MSNLNRWWSIQLNRGLTAHTLCHSSCCTSFSVLHSCFPMFSVLYCYIMFLVKFWKRSFLDVLEFWILYTCFFWRPGNRHVLVLYFGFLNPYCIYQESWLSTADQTVLNQKGGLERGRAGVGFCICILS